VGFSASRGMSVWSICSVRRLWGRGRIARPAVFARCIARLRSLHERASMKIPHHSPSMTSVGIFTRLSEISHA